MRIVDPETGRPYVEKRRVRTRAWLCEALDAARTKCGFQLWAYVVMPEHVHVLVCPGEAPHWMPEFLRAVKEPVARKAIQHLKHGAPEWLARVTVREGRR